MGRRFDSCRAHQRVSRSGRESWPRLRLWLALPLSMCQDLCANDGNGGESQDKTNPKGEHIVIHVVHAMNKSRHRLTFLFHVHCGSVSQDFGDALHNFGRVITHSDNGVGTQFGSVLQHEVEGVFAGLLA